MEIIMSELEQLPQQFHPFLEKIKSTRVTCIEFDKERSDEFKPWDSNLGGSPYLPLGFEYPKSKESDQPLQFLGQINFGEIPHLENFPDQGILQFYLNMKDLGLGIDESRDNVQINHRVLYFPIVVEEQGCLQQVENFKALTELSEDEEQLWVAPSRLIDFRFVQQYMTFFDYRFAPLLFNRTQVETNNTYADIAHAYEYYEKPYTEYFQTEGGHRLGGYANFLHSRDNRIELGIQDHILLMQLDTDDGLEWCDGGIAQWYIHPQDLKNKDFSQVIFQWACH